jgi:glycosyltransferase involved in cell wall biosynthesis
MWFKYRIVNEEQQLMNRKIIIYAHFSGNGNTEELRDWLIRHRVQDLVYIAFPFGDCADSAIRLYRYQDGQLVEARRSLVCFKAPFVLSYLKDVLYGLLWGLRYGKNADWFFGGDNLLSLCGLLLRRLCRIKKVCYYMIDYTPRRYVSRLLNGLYYRIDRIAAEGCDEVWVLAQETIQGRFEDGRLTPETVRWKLVPYGTHALQVLLPESVRPNRLVYMGGLLESKGAHQLLEIYKAVLRRCPDTAPPEMVIIGRGPLELLLRQQVAEQGLSGSVRILGYVENNRQMLAELAQGGIALAPYDPEDANSFSFYADAGKLKVYIGCGLPVVATDVPPFVREIAGHHAGRIASYDANDFAEQIDEIFHHYEVYRTAALALSTEYNWDTVFTRAFDL